VQTADGRMLAGSKEEYTPTGGWQVLPVRSGRRITVSSPPAIPSSPRNRARTPYDFSMHAHAPDQESQHPDGEHLEATAASCMAALEESFPLEPAAKLQRFAIKRYKDPSKAVARFAKHLQWRQDEGSAESLLSAYRKVPKHFVTAGGQAANDGSSVIFVEGARYNFSAAAPEEYTLAIAHVLDTIFLSDEDRRLTVLIDCRAGDTWPNPSAFRLLPFFTIVARVLSFHYPTRMNAILVYPVPGYAASIISLLEGLIPSDTLKKIKFIPGDKRSCPVSVLRKYVSKESLPTQAWARHADL